MINEARFWSCLNSSERSRAACCSKLKSQSKILALLKFGSDIMALLKFRSDASGIGAAQIPDLADWNLRSEQKDSQIEQLSWNPGSIS
jgi:hypothetical protein